jgi:hypothetical protein
MAYAVFVSIFHPCKGSQWKEKKPEDRDRCFDSEDENKKQVCVEDVRQNMHLHT